jgi:hypothetical protein
LEAIKKSGEIQASQQTSKGPIPPPLIDLLFRNCANLAYLFNSLYGSVASSSTTGYIYDHPTIHRDKLIKMVATRNHPKDFPPPPASLTGESSPTKRTTRSSTTAASASPTPTPTKSSSSTTSLSKATDPSGARAAGAWTHTPSNLTLIWLAISLPLVIWDTGYVLLRPWSMPGGFLHSPIWAPYELYGRVDYVYGWPAYESNDGWTASQGWVNLVETAAYLGYLYLVYAYGARESEVVGRGAPDAMRSVGGLRWLTESRTLEGRVAAIAVLVAYSTALVTFAKTVLYCEFPFCCFPLSLSLSPSPFLLLDGSLSVLCESFAFLTGGHCC